MNESASAPGQIRNANVRTVIQSNGKPRRFVLSQPPQYRIGQAAAPVVDPVERAALVALKHTRNERSQRMSAKAA